ncbi:MAG: translation initiation factor IF-2 [Clostridia bacterium]|nr:translation initiation factor IF-2 [Clostridia bacterium]
MVVKYKVNEVAKDFAQDTKDLLAILKEKFPERALKNTTALEEVELNYIFDYLTQKNSVKSFDEYFALGEKAQEKREQEKKAKKEARLKEQELLAAQLKAAMAAQNGEKVEPKKEEKPEAKKETPKTKPVKKVEEKKEEVKKPKVEEKPQEPKVKKEAAPKKVEEKKEAAPEQKRQDKKKAPAKPRTEGRIRDKGDNKNIEIHTVESYKIDTRASNFDEDKYNEKYDEISPAHKYGDNFQKKQKIKQKSKQYNKGGKGKKQETEADRLRKIQLEKIKAKPIEVTIGDEITVGELASRMKKTAAEVVKQLMLLGIMAGASETIDYDTAAIVATEMGAKVTKEVVVTIEERIMDIQEDKEEDLRPRDPVVVVMGHVDHGKTSILDRIRSASVTSTEAGGITQHIGAYQVTVEGDKNITFLDTPGHAAFTAMRQRGANVTDIAILVVAADDGIMPQTVEAINHAKAAGVEIIVAINKMDKPGVTTDNIMQQLTEYELVPEQWGGNIIVVPVSAHTGMGIDDLLSNVLLVAEMQELKANPDRMAKGAVIEAKLDKGRGPVATILVQNGTLHVGDIIVAGKTVGRVRVMLNDKGERVKVAGPSVPVEITGLDEVPSAGDSFDCVSDERLARELVEQRKAEFKEEEFNKYQKVTLDNLFDQLQQGEMKDLNIIVKADVQGSVEAVRQSLEKLTNEEVRVKVIHGAVGAVSESDVMLAAASNAIIVGFNVRPDAVAKNLAEKDGVDMRLYRIIYDAIEEIEAAIKGMLAPKFREVQLGFAEVRETYKISSVGTIAGCYVKEGKVTRNAQIRVVRDGIVIAEDLIDSLRRFKDDVKEVATNFECGIGLEKFNDIKEGDILEAFIIEEYRD